jgi:flagellar hook assembly protein FlgD
MTGVDASQSKDITESFRLYQNYPNPFNPSTVINFSIANRGNVRLEVFDVLGRLVTTIVNQEMGAGSYRVVWEGSDRNGAKVSSGIYFYRIRSGSFTASKKMLMLK